MGQKVFILEDNRDLLESYLEAIENFTSGSAFSIMSYSELKKNSDEVLDTQIAFLDMNLSGDETGIDAYHWLRENHYQGRIYFLTGQINDELTALQQGSDGKIEILYKPIDLESFIKIIDEHNYRT